MQVRNNRTTTQGTYNQQATTESSSSQQAINIFEAIDSGDLEQIKAVLHVKGNAVVHSTNQDGDTPLHSAVDNGNLEVVELLLQAGASANFRNRDGDTPLHWAVDNGNLEAAVLLLQAGATVNSRNQDGETPLHWAVDNGNLETAELLLQAGASVNTLNEWDVSVVQRVMREGDMPLLNLFRKYSDSNTWRTNEKANIHKSTLAACKSDFNEVDFNAIDMDQISFEPLTIAQKFCTAIVRLKNGDLYSIDGVNADELRMYLLEKKFGPEYAEQHANVNRFTAYMSPHHAFLRLDSEAEGSIYSESRGFSTFEGDEPSKKERKADAWEENDYETVATVLEAIDYIKYVIPGKGALNDEKDSKAFSEAENHLKVKFLLDDDQARAALSQITKVDQSCSTDSNEACVYEMFGSNCVTFVQQVYDSTGMKGNMHDYFTDEELGYGHAKNLDPIEIYENKALAYGYAQSRGIDHYLDTTFDITTRLERLGVSVSKKEPLQIAKQIAASSNTSQQMTHFQVRTNTPEHPCYYTSGETNVIDMTGDLPAGALLTKCKLPPYKPTFQKSEIIIATPFFQSAIHSAAISGVSTLTIDVAKELNVPAEYIRIAESTVSILTTIYNSQSIIPTLGSEAMFHALKSNGFSDSQARIASRVTNLTIRAAQNYTNPLGFAASFAGELAGSAVGTTLAKGVFYGAKSVVYGTQELVGAAMATASYIVPNVVKDRLFNLVRI